MAETVSQEFAVKKGSIHCSGCETTIERFVGRMPGVERVKASEKTQSVAITWDPEKATTEGLKAKLGELGYPAA